jgi:hypothetical protein
MSDARRQLAVEVAQIFARQLLAVMPELEAATKDGAPWVEVKIAFPRNKAGQLACKLTVSGVKTRPARAKPLLIQLSEEQLALFT